MNWNARVWAHRGLQNSSLFKKISSLEGFEALLRCCGKVFLTFYDLHLKGQSELCASAKAE